MLRVSPALLALLLAGCYTAQHPGAGDGGSVDDGPPNDPDGPPGCGSLVQHCFDPRSTVTIMGDIDTDNDPAGLCATDNNAVCVIAANTVTFDSGLHTVQVTGGRPLAIITGDTLELGGNLVLDASSHQSDDPEDTRLGAGHATNSSCAPAQNVIGSAGGVGGSYGTSGGGGGADASANTLRFDAQVPTTLVGGCPGDFGGPTGGQGTPPGGALYLFSNHDIHVDGRVIASGAGGHGGAGLSGGDGGGTGGTIVFEARTITGAGTIAAVGGNGGGGGDATASGHTGDDGGVGAGSGGKGGGTAGGAGGNTTKPVGLDAMGGLGVAGGGGGGAGGLGEVFVLGSSQLTGTRIPTPTVVPP